MTDSADSLDCDAGFYCSSRSPIAAPVGESYGDECPTGAYCPVGSDAPILCAAGTYNNETRQSSCRTCPAGFYCQINTTQPVSCPEGYICLEGQGEAYTYPCDAGKFNNLTERYQASHCQSCLPGYVLKQADCATISEFNASSHQITLYKVLLLYKCKLRFRMYCETPGLGWPTGECWGGWYCALGSAFANPSASGGRHTAEILFSASASFSGT